MFTRPPEISDAQIAEVLRRWGIEDVAVDYVAVGFGSHHWTVRASAGRWFLTVDDLAAQCQQLGEPNGEAMARLRAALEAACVLAERLFFVVAPIPAPDGSVLVAVDERFVAALYPHVDGDTFDHGEYSSDLDRREVLALLAQLHDSTVPRAARVEDFVIPHRNALSPAGDWGAGPYADRARDLLARQWALLDEKFTRYGALVQAALGRPDRFVVTHGEPHRANTIATERGRVLIDWDTALVAPPERDLWMVVAADSPLLHAYEAARGTSIDPAMFELYKLQWDLMEVAGYIAFFRDDHDDTRDAQESWKNLQHFIS